MSLKTIYAELKTAVSNIVDDNNEKVFKYVGIWNNQVRSLRSKQNDIIQTQYPAAYIEVIVEDIEQQHCIHQLWNLIINIHIIDDFYNNEITENEENVRIFETTDYLWDYIQQTRITNSGTLVCISNVQEFDHDNLYHYIQSYKCPYEKLYDNHHILMTGITYALTGHTSVLSGFTGNII